MPTVISDREKYVLSLDTTDNENGMLFSDIFE